MWGMQTGLGIPKHADAAQWNSSFVRLYYLVEMTLVNASEFRSVLTHAIRTLHRVVGLQASDLHVEVGRSHLYNLPP